MICNFLLRIIPPSLIRKLGQLQFKFPLLKPLINRVARGMAKEGIIQRGAGKGLNFNTEGCNPGFLMGTSEPLEQELVEKYAVPGSVVYELGANAGFYVIIAARCVGSTGSVYAFEPTPNLVERIKENAQRNNLKNIHVIEAAVSNADGTISFGVSGSLSVENSINSASAGPSISVEAITLDTFASNNPPPNFVLIDIEGAEMDALKGGLEMIKKHRPVLMIEVHWLGQPFIDFFENHLLPLGYQAQTYDGQPLPEGLVRYHALITPT